MGNSNNIGGLLRTSNSQILAAGLNIPPNFNNSPQPGKLVVLYNNSNNAKVIYNTNAYKTLPYNQQLLDPLAIGSHVNIVQDGIQDVSLISKWSVSNAGIKFAIKQAVLQGLNVFNETKIYNPVMPIVGASADASFGLIDPPIRFIEPDLGGVLGAIGLSSVSSLFGGNIPVAPAGTVGSNALPQIATDGAKGLSRGQSATTAFKTFTNKWPANSTFGGSFLSNAITAGVNFLKANTPLGTFLPVGQPAGTRYKAADTKIYGLMLNNTSNGLFSMAALDFSDGDSSYNNGGVYVQKYSAGSGIGGNASTTYSDAIIHDEFNNTDTSALTAELGAFTTSSDGSYPSNFNNPNNQNITSKIAQLTSLLNVAQKNGYTTTPADYIATDYQELVGIKSQQDGDGNVSPQNYNNSTSVVSYAKSLKNNKNLLTNKGIDTNVADLINLKGIISGSSDFFGGKSLAPSTGYPNIYSPYADDIIAFYFHDLVNNKYIPFRATVKGIQESAQAEWTDVKYINRADKLYTYGGFTRTLNFSFTVNISSIKELLPTWRRVNYFMGLVKPANYTDGSIFSRFIIPPLIKFTIGDMYKNQPAVITQIGMSIPDDATWETLSETYALVSKEDWSYLNGRISFLKSNNQYAQFPNQCEISVNLNLLEKELPKTGGSNYGDYYFDKNFNAIGSSGQNSFSSNMYTSQVSQNITASNTTISSVGNVN
jgi:hypothetical protein